MRQLLAGLVAFAALVLGASDLRAAAQAECDAPFAFDGPVQVFVLQYGFEPDPTDREVNARLSETARRLSYVIQRDVLSNDSFGSLAVILLDENRPGACQAAEVQERLLDFGVLEPAQAIALIWGRMYQEGDDVFVQSYLRFLRVDPRERRYVDERFEVVLPEPEQRLQGSLPTQSVAFAPRKLHAGDLERIDAAWQDAARLFQEPDAYASWEFLPSPDVPLAYFVHETRPDGWLRIELQTGEEGWLRADPQVGQALRALMPELHYVEAVIGYLSYRQAAAGAGARMSPEPWMLDRIGDRLTRFATADAEAGGEPRAEVAMVASSLLGTLQAFETDDQVAAGLDALRSALRERPEDGKLRNLVAMAELRQCCAADTTGPALRQVPEMLLAGLAVDPNNADLLANLQATYAWLAGEPARGETDRPALATGTVRANANLRAEPSIDAPQVGLAAGGSRITIKGTDAGGQWLRVERGAGQDAFIAARLVQDLEPSELECGTQVTTEVCEALRSGVQDAQEPSILPEVFDTLEIARTRGTSVPASRLATAGLTPAEASTRLQEVEELRQALDALN